MKTKSIFQLGSLALAVAATSIGVYSAELEEITVTAQKRSESLQDVPMSITALGGERMEEAGIDSFSDLSSHVPNLEIAENAVNTIITLRGISVGSNQSFEQSVGVYVDGVHHGKSRQIRTGLFDLEQVEVLRGPQGTLFGKNTLAGAINVTSATPQIGNEDNGRISLSTESNNGQVIEGNLNTSPSDNLALRLAFKDREDDGYMDNRFNGSVNPTMPTTDEEILRLSALWQPNEKYSLKFKHTESDYVRLGGPATITTYEQVENSDDVDGLLFAAMAASGFDIADDLDNGIVQPNRDSISFGGCELAAYLDPSSACEPDTEKPEGTDTKSSDSSINLDIDLGNGYAFSSVTGINGYEYEDGIDADFLPLQFVGRSDISDYDQISQEFRISSPQDQKLSYITGAYITSSDQEIDRLVAIDGTLNNPVLVGQIMQGNYALQQISIDADQITSGIAMDPMDIISAGLADNQEDAVNMLGSEGVTQFSQVGRLSNWKQETDSWAVFFQGKYQLKDDLSITAGLRYTEEDKKAHADMALTYGDTGLTTPSNNPLLAGVMGSVFGSYAHNFDEERTTDHLIPSANIQWEQSDLNKYYLSYSEGFKSGGFNAVDDQKPVLAADGTVPDPTAPGEGFEYDDETSSSWEIGGKHDLLNGSMNLNWAYFDSDYENQQVSTFVGVGFVVTNAASSSVSGLEVDLTWQATDRLRLGTSFALLDGKYDSFVGAGCTAEQTSELKGLFDDDNLTADDSSEGCTPVLDENGVATDEFTQDISGGQLGADYSGSITADYEYPLGNGMTLFAGGDYYFSDNWFLSGDLDPIDQQDAFDRVNVRTGVRTDDWDLMIYAQNVTDEIYTGGAADVPLHGGAHFKYLQPGKILGAKFSLRF
jgi:outer membrane receptor protein involved in Fe transport